MNGFALRTSLSPLLSLGFVAASLVAPASSTAGPCTGACNQVEIACLFENKAIFDGAKETCLAERAECAEICNDISRPCFDSCDAQFASCEAGCDALTRRGDIRRCDRKCLKSFGACKVPCNKPTLPCKGECRAEGLACRGDADGALLDGRAECDAGRTDCIDQCSSVEDTSCVRSCTGPTNRCLRRSKTAKARCFKSCRSSTVPGCKPACRTISVESNRACTDALGPCLEGCSP